MGWASGVSVLCMLWDIDALSTLTFQIWGFVFPIAVLSRCHLVFDKPLFTTYSAVIFMTVNLLDNNAAISLCLRSWEEDTTNPFPFFLIYSLLEINLYSSMSNLSADVILTKSHITLFSVKSSLTCWAWLGSFDIIF